MRKLWLCGVGDEFLGYANERVSGFLVMIILMNRELFGDRESERLLSYSKECSDEDICWLKEVFRFFLF